MKNLKNCIYNKINTFSDLLKHYKINSFYIKSLQIKTDYSRYKTYFRNFHPRHYDVDRSHSKYVRENRDYKDLSYFTKDPLHFDHHLPELLGSLDDHIQEIKKTNALGNLSNSLISPYKVINMMYNMVITNHPDKNFYKQIESTINIHTIVQDTLHPRYPFAYLYCAYKTGIYKEEAMTFFENHLEELTYLVHSRWAISLLDALINSPYFDETKLSKMVKCLEDCIVLNWDRQIRYNLLNLINLAHVLGQCKISNDDIWNCFLNEINQFNFISDKINKDSLHKDKKNQKSKSNNKKLPSNRYRLPSLEHIHVILNALNKNVKDPKFYKFEDAKILNTINKWKDAINADSNKSYLYNTKELRYNNIDELIKKRNDITPETHILESVEKEDKAYSLIQEKKKVIVPKKEIYNYFNSLLDPDKRFSYIRHDVSVKYVDYLDYVNSISSEMHEKFKKMYYDKLIKDNKFDKLFEDKPDAKEGAGLSTSSSNQASSDNKKEAGGKAKKKK